MKRSTAVTLVLAGSTAVVALYACDRPKAESYPNVQACVDAKRHTEAECEAAFSQAAREHEQSAPHFESRANCVAEYGPTGCEERPGSGGSSIFVPLMLGYVLGQGLGYHPLYQSPIGQGCRVAPDGRRYGDCPGGWFGHGGGWFGGGGRSFFGGSGGSSAGSSAGSETSTVSRGGFGATGHSFGGGGE
jgi:uncharacterized protein YgiB involved in biofilm formation